MCDGEGSPDPRRRPPGTPAPAPRRPSDRASGRRAAPAADPAPGSSGYARPPQACLGHTASNTAVARQPDGDLAEQRGDRVLTIILDPAGRATAAARRGGGRPACGGTTP